MDIMTSKLDKIFIWARSPKRGWGESQPVSDFSDDWGRGD